MGYKIVEIAKIINRRRQTISAYINAYKKNSLKGLETGQKVNILYQFLRNK
ncbi:hypothetical protein KM885_17555 [Oceanobacillus caeni]|nr:hypothetical protein [Oceanobacillus caeni]